MHPKERRLATTRRDFLLRSGGAAVSLSSMSGLLAACGTHHSRHQQLRWRLADRRGRHSARPSESPRDARALGGADRVGHAAGDRRHVHHLQLPGVHRPGGAQGLRQEVRGHGEGHAVRRHHHRRHEAGIGDRVAGRDRDDARPAPPRRRGQAGEAAQSRLHPEPEERLVRFQEPVLRRRIPLLRAVHGVQHRHRVPHRPRQGGHPQPEAQPLGHLLAGPGVQGQDRAALRGARDDRDGAPAPRGSRTSTPRTRSSSTRP